MARGVRATGNSLRVTAFTLLSVACAERITATSNSNGVEYSSSVVGCGFAARNRSKIARRLRGIHAVQARTRPALLVGEHGGALRGAARDALVVAPRSARGCRAAGGSASAACAGLASSGIMTMQSTGQGAMHSSQPVHSCGDDGVHEARRADDGVHRAGRQALGAADAALLVDEGHRGRGLDAVVRD